MSSQTIRGKDLRLSNMTRTSRSWAHNASACSGVTERPSDSNQILMPSPIGSLGHLHRAHLLRKPLELRLRHFDLERAFAIARALVGSRAKAHVAEEIPAQA